MRRFVSLLLMIAAAVQSAVAQGKSASIPTNAPALISLRDQFDAPQKLSFPSANLTVLTIADRKGADQIAGWVTPLQRQFGTRIDIRGVADVSKVPHALQSLVRVRFQKLLTYPVMMDWSGEVVGALTYVPNKANVLVLDGSGRILRRVSGIADDKAVQDMCATITKALAERTDKVSR
jgi:hypothetical protein